MAELRWPGDSMDGGSSVKCHREFPRVKNIVRIFGARVKVPRVSGSGDYVKVIPLVCFPIGLLFIKHFALLQRKHVASWSNRAFERIFSYASRGVTFIFMIMESSVCRAINTRLLKPDL